MSEATEEIAYVKALEKDYIQSVHYLLDKGHKVVLIYPMPEIGWDVHKHLMKIVHMHSKLLSYDGSISHERFQKRNSRSYAALDALGEHDNLTRVYPEKLFCNTILADRCVAHIDERPLFSDDNHLSQFGAEMVIKEIQRHL